MDKISALFDGVWTTMEDWGAATTFNYGIAVLIPIVIVLVLALVTKDTFVSFFAGIIAAFLMAAKGHPLVAIGLFRHMSLSAMMVHSGFFWSAVFSEG